MKLYVSNIVESYEDTIIGSLENVGIVYLLLHIVKCLRACAVDKENRYLPIVMYCSGMMYKYYAHLEFLPIKHNE